MKRPRSKTRVSFEARLRELILSSGSTPYAVAQAAEIPHSSLGYFLAGERGLTSATIAKLFEVLGLDITGRGRLP